jgi:hypothetical protein
MEKAFIKSILRRITEIPPLPINIEGITEELKTTDSYLKLCLIFKNKETANLIIQSLVYLLIDQYKIKYEDMNVESIEIILRSATNNITKHYNAILSIQNISINQLILG